MGKGAWGKGAWGKGAWGKGHFRKGKALAALQRYEEARAAFELGHQCEPDNEDFLQAIAALP